MAARRHFSGRRWHAHRPRGRRCVLVSCEHVHWFCQFDSELRRPSFPARRGRGVNWPGASKAVAEWFPGEERSLAVAIFDSGSSVGGALAAMMIPWIALAFGWRWAFVFSGMLGFLWLGVWLRVYHPLDRHPRLTADEVTFIEAGKRADRIKCNLGRPRVISNLSDCHKPSIGTQPMSASNAGMRFSTCHFSLLPIMFFAAFGTNGAFAQFTTARLSGVVTDNVNAAMPDATVTALQVSTGYKQTAKTGASGDYLFPSLPIGTYRLNVKANGFTPFVQDGIVLNVKSGSQRECEVAGRFCESAGHRACGCITGHDRRPNDRSVNQPEKAWLACR